ncbi:MAG: hypothetical protein AAF958_12925 [Planctomycetota bacterium]
MDQPTYNVFVAGEQDRMLARGLHRQRPDGPSQYQWCQLCDSPRVVVFMVREDGQPIGAAFVARAEAGHWRWLLFQFVDRSYETDRSRSGPLSALASAIFDWIPNGALVQFGTEAVVLKKPKATGTTA